MLSVQKSQRTFVACATALLLVCVVPVHADTVLNFAGSQSKLTAQAMGNGTLAEASFEPSSLPYLNAHSVTQGFSANTTAYNLSEGLLRIDATHTRAGTADDRAESLGRIFFTVTEDTPYSLAGQYAAVDPVPGRVSIQVRLTDVGSDSVLFNNRQLSDGTANESFVVGGQGGDTLNVLTGSQSDVLLAGRRYELFYDLQTRAFNADDGATAGGYLALQIGPPAAVPLPPAALGGAVLMGIMGAIKLRPKPNTA